jgi:hypothetical protein
MLILRRCCIKDIWYIAWVLCQLATQGLEWNVGFTIRRIYEINTRSAVTMFTYTNTPNIDSLRCWLSQRTAKYVYCCLFWIPIYKKIIASDWSCVRCKFTMALLRKYHLVLPKSLSYVRGSTMLNRSQLHTALNASLMSDDAYYTTLLIENA